MATVAVLYRRLLELLAVVAGLMLAAMAFAIVLDVLVRNLGLQPPAHTLTLTEYGLLYLTMLAAPWLVREKGHVHIELVTAALRPRPRFWLTRVVYASVRADLRRDLLLRARGHDRPLPAVRDRRALVRHAALAPDREHPAQLLIFFFNNIKYL